jgi:ATP-dependent DNA helicase RecG
LTIALPARPVGTPLQYNGRYLMRSGESLTAMTPDRLQAIFAERQPDFSAMPLPGTSLADLDPAAIERFRSLWHRKSGNDELLRLPAPQLLTDAELVGPDGTVKVAALVLLGKQAALARHLPQAELIFEYRSSEGSIPYQQRKEYRQGYLLYDDDLWNLINVRNEVQPVRDGMFIAQVPMFNDDVVREALLNAVCHREYRLGESIFVRQYPTLLEVESPGGLPDGITPETILQRQYRRNRLIAEALQKCGLIERSSQGVDKMFRLMLRHAKRRPDYSASDENRVLVRLYGEVQDPAFFNYLERLSRQTGVTLTLSDLLLLDEIRQGKVQRADEHVQRLLKESLVEKVSRGRGTRYILSKKYYAVAGQKGTYTRTRGLDRETNKALILTHLDHHGQGTIKEFEEVLAPLNRNQIHGLLKELRDEKKIRYVGSRRSGYWEKV